MSRELIDLSPPLERALLVGAPLKRSLARHHTDDHLEELARLTDTAGAEVVGTLTQQLDRPNAATYLGSGKIDELRLRVEETGATLLVFDDELSPSQGKNIETLTNVRVLDRAELILDIFATRARSSDAKLQVELAQLQYMLPRLTRMWAHLEKFRGGIGVRGPGETQLETDRRLIGHRIRVLKQRLEETRRSREVRRAGRKNIFQASLVGYTNAGKSSLLRTLARDERVFVEDRLFATLDPLTREINVDDGVNILLTDTVGFVRKLPHQLIASFRATLEEVVEADLLLHVVDISNPAWEEQRQVVQQVLAELGAQDKPTMYVFNKIDLLSPEDLAAARERLSNLLPGSVFTSSADPAGAGSFRRALVEHVRDRQSVLKFRIPASDGRSIAELYRTAEVLDQETDGDSVVISARVNEAAAGRLARFVA